MKRRRRRRASDIADVRPRRGLGAAFVLAIGLGLVVLYKAGVGEETAGFITQVAGDPELELPPSVLDRMDFGPVDGGPVEAGRGVTPTDADADAAPSDGGLDASLSGRGAGGTGSGAPNRAPAD